LLLALTLKPCWASSNCREMYAIGTISKHCPISTSTLSFLLWLWLVGSWPFFKFLILYTFGRTPWTSDQPVARPLPTHRINAHKTDIRASSGIRTHDPSVRAGEDSYCLRPRGHCDGHLVLLQADKCKQCRLIFTFTSSSSLLPLFLSGVCKKRNLLYRTTSSAVSRNL
jgi:hypothetical protein